jgi:hypothetical protein
MSFNRFRLLHRGRTGGSLLAIPFDTRWGTSTDASGWITQNLPSGGRLTYLDTVNGNDANTGLSHAQAVKTYNIAFNKFIGSGLQAGDKLLIREGSTAVDTTNSSLTPIGSASGAGPSLLSAIQSYDPTDPTNAAKWGRAIGSAMPVIIINATDGTSLSLSAGVNAGYVMIQGIEVKCTTNATASQSTGVSWNARQHPGVVVQNVRFNGVQFGVSTATGSFTAGTNTPNAGLISKCSFWGGAGIFIEETDSFKIQEVAVVHGGWDIFATRDDPIIYGGSSTFAHAFYLHASNTNLWLNRVICVDATDGLGARCGSPNANQLISIDNPVGLNSAGKSTDVMLERPDGAPWYCDDAVIMGLNSEICPQQLGGWAIEWSNNIAGSYTRNVAAFDFDQYGYDATYNRLAAGTRLSSSLPASNMLLDKWSTYQIAVTGESDVPGSDPTNYVFNITNSIVDVAPTGYNATPSNVSTRSTPPAGYKTRAQTYAALGYANKAEFVNVLCWRPDLIGQYAQAICGISLPAMGLAPLYQTASAPPSPAPPTQQAARLARRSSYLPVAA